MSSIRHNCERCGALITPSVERYQIRRMVPGGSVYHGKVEAYLCEEHGREVLAVERMLARQTKVEVDG